MPGGEATPGIKSQDLRAYHEHPPSASKSGMRILALLAGPSHDKTQHRTGRLAVVLSPTNLPFLLQKGGGATTRISAHRSPTRRERKEREKKKKKVPNNPDPGRSQNDHNIALAVSLPQLCVKCHAQRLGTGMSYVYRRRVLSLPATEKKKSLTIRA